MEAIYSGLKCDTLGCDYRNDIIVFEDYPKYINKPCPNCGGPLLTEKDYKHCVRVIKLVKVLHWINPLNWFGYKPKETYNINIHYNNDGTRDVTVDENTEE